MGALSTFTYSDWASGVITSMEPDAVPANGYIKGKNTALMSIGGGRAVVRKRLGVASINGTPVTGTPEIGGLHEYRKLVAQDTVTYRMLCSDTGRLDTVDLTAATYGTLTNISATAFTPRTVYGEVFQFADANNLCYIVNGTDQVKFNGTVVQNIGIIAPLAAPAVAAGAAGTADGTYEGRVTYGNSAAGTESSAGPTSATVTVGANTLNWSAIPVSPDTQVDRRYLYIRNTATMAEFYLAGTVSNNTATTASTNFLDVALTTIGPSTTENNPPPDNIKFIAFHKSRLFLADLTNVYYSKLDNIEAFDPLAFESPDPDNGQQIRAIISFADMLVILKERSAYALIGDDPDFWAIRQIDPSVGCISPRGVKVADNQLFWWSEQGPVKWIGRGPVDNIGTPLIDNTLTPGGTNAADTGDLPYHQSDIYRLSAGVDIEESRIIWSLPTILHSTPHDNTGTRNTVLLPFSTRLDRWESDGWDPMDISALDTWHDDDGVPFVVMGGYKGQIWRMDSGLYDGATTGTLTGTFVASGTTAATITGTGFVATGSKLTERKVTIVDANGLPTSFRPYISSNTSTVLTLSETVTGLTNGATYTYYIAGPAFDFESAWLTNETPFVKKRYRFVYMHTRSADVTDLRVDLYNSYQLTTSSNSLIDINNNATEADLVSRVRVGLTGNALLMRLRQFKAGDELILLKLGLLTETLNDNLG